MLPINMNLRTAGGQTVSVTRMGRGVLMLVPKHCTVPNTRNNTSADHKILTQFNQPTHIIFVTSLMRQPVNIANDNNNNRSYVTAPNTRERTECMTLQKFAMKNLQYLHPGSTQFCERHNALQTTITAPSIFYLPVALSQWRASHEYGR